MGLMKRTIDLFSETLRLSFTDAGEGRPNLLLHGGAGPASISGLGRALLPSSRVITPTHPGFDGEPRPERFARIDDLATAYLALIERLDLQDVVVIGNSVGGWIAAEMALRQSPRLAAIVLINSVGIETGAPVLAIANPMAATPAERGAMAFHDPQKFAAAPSGPEAAAAMAANQKTLGVYAGEPFMHEPTLRSRLAEMRVPALVAWGISDRIVDTSYGRLLAGSIPGARFEPIEQAGHFPQIERLDEVVRLVRDFNDRN
jgi:pimeloyl-ACP methyl ester carboxylesterase